MNRISKLKFTGNVGLNENKYVVGAGVGAKNASVRRALVRRASNSSSGKCCKHIVNNYTAK